MIRYSTAAGSPVVEIGVEGTVTNADLETSITRLADDIERNGKTRLIEVIEHFTGIEPAAIWTDLKLGLPLAQKVTRVAVVADIGWIRALTGLGHFFTKAELKVFEPAEIEVARAWVAAN
jgi:hypothetical protein